MSDKTKLGAAELLFRCAEQMGLQPSWIKPKGLFVVTIAGKDQYINSARSPLNSQLSSSLSKDKYLTRLILKRNNLPNIPFARPKTEEEALQFLSAHQKIIVKPITGSESHDVHIVTSIDQLKNLHVSNYIFEKYIAGEEMRYLILNGAVIAVHRSDYGTSVSETRPLQRISHPKSEWDILLTSLSIKIADLLGLKYAAIDYLIDPSGNPHILEVNSAPGLKWFHAPTSGPVVDVARMFLEAMLEEIALPPEVTVGLSATPAYY